MNRTPIAQLELAGSTNVGRAVRRDRAGKPMSADTRREIQQLDELIQQTIEDCRQGSTVGEKQKANPSFANLNALIKARAVLLRSYDPSKKSADELLAEVDALLGEEN